jgi:methyl-accepting chemotaxis protein
MDANDAIDAGINAHRLWKQRLAEAVTSGRSEWTPEDVCRDDGCEFGRWLREGIAPRDRATPHFAKVRALHAAFHQSAGQVLRLALGGRRAEAEQAIASGSAFTKASSALVVAMMDWKAARRG